MTPEQRRAYDHARYLRQREQRTAHYRERYRNDPYMRSHKCAYLRGYQAGLRKAAKDAATTPSTTTNPTE